MYCVIIGEEIVYACTDWSKYLRTVVTKYMRVTNARMEMADGTKIKL